MNDELIIKLAQEAGWGFNNSRDSDFVKAQLRFARLVAAIEREKCAQVCELVSAGGIGDIGDDTAQLCAAQIRAR